MEKLSRYDFLKSCGFTGGALMALLSCVNENDKFVEALTQNPDGSFTNPDGTLVENGSGLGPDILQFVDSEMLENITPIYRVDLTNPLYQKLQIRNNFIVLGNTFVLALSKTGQYIAATVVCSHENNRTISYRNGEWFCPQHGARYNLDGKGLNDYGKNGIKVYKTSTDGELLIIHE